MCIAATLAALLAAAPLAGEIPVTSRSPAAVGQFRAGRVKALNFQNVEAAALLKKALAADPGFPQALAWLGKVTPGAPGLSLLERAAQLSAPLGAAERKTIEAMLAERKGEGEKARNLRRELADLAPHDWLPQFQLGVQSVYDHKSQAAILYLDRAIRLNPGAAEAYNYLGYVLAEQGQYEDGIRAVKKFVELKPQEPNSYDSLGEVLLIAGRFDQAEEAFARSAALASDNWMSWVGVAYARFLRGNFDGGREAVERSKRWITRAPDRLAVDETLAWSWLAQGKADQALAGVEAIERQAVATHDDFQYAWSAFERAEMLLELGRGMEAMSQLEQARARGERGKLTPDQENRLRRSALVLQARIGARAGSPADAEQAFDRLEAELRSSPSNADLRGDVHYARGLVALAHGLPEKAAESFAFCPATSYYCRRDLIFAQIEAGDAGQAGETRRKLLAANARDNVHRGADPEYLFVSAQLKAAAAAP